MESYFNKENNSDFEFVFNYTEILSQIDYM